MHHYFIMPFSKSLSIEVYAKKLAHGRPWARFCQPLVDAGMSEEDAYHAFLYSEERMSHKFAAFERIALAQILKAVGDRSSWSLLIYITGEVMPQAQQARLAQLVSPYPNIDIVSVPKGGIFHEMCTDYRSKIDRSGRYTTIRIDDDDGVPSDLLSNVERWAQTEPGPFLYTVPHLRTAGFDASGDLVLGDVGEHPTQAASGLVAVDSDVYALGTHTTISARHPHLRIVRDYSAEPILMSCHEDHCISLRKFVDRFNGFSYSTSPRPGGV